MISDRTELAAAPAWVFLGLGSNLGDRQGLIRAALGRLAPQVQIARVSSLYESEPAYVTDQPRFLNAVASGQTGLGPHELLALLKQIERELGRVAGQRFGPRAIDLDLLLYNTLQIETADLTLPHPRIAERPFVLVPLAEIAPELYLPGTGRQVAELAATVRGHGDVTARVGSLDPGVGAKERRV